MEAKNKPIVHLATAKSLNAYITNPLQAVILHGQEGSNYTAVADYIAESLAKKHNTSSEHIYTLNTPDKSASISIDTIHQLMGNIKYKNTHSDVIVVIHNADTMSTEAQNRLLKVLEEPSERTYFILSTSKPERLLATIKSRASSVELKNPNLDQIIESYGNKFDTTAIKRAHSLSGGAVMSLENILQEKENTSIDIAKNIVSSKQFDRLSHIDMLTKDRDSTLKVLDVLMRIYSTLLRLPANRADAEKMSIFTSKLALCEESYGAVKHNSNIKITLTRLFINL